MIGSVGFTSVQIQEALQNREEFLEKQKNDLVKCKQININSSTLYETCKRFTATHLKIQDLTQKREAFEKKYGDNPWLKTALRVLALVCIGLSIYGIVKIVSASHAWINAPRLPGEPYSNFETFIFSTVMTFGIGALVFLAIPGVPIFLLAGSAMLATPMLFSPKNTIMAFAPSADREREINEKQKNEIMKILNINDNQFEELKNKINSIINDQNTDEDGKKSLLIECLREHSTSFDEKLKWQEDYIADLNMERRQDNDDE